MDEALQAGHVATFEDIVAQTMANNNFFKSTAESAMAANRGRMSTAVQTYLSELVTHSTVNNQKLEAITQALGFGVKSTGSTDESNAAPFQVGQF
jgi:hypothetical protein